MNICDNMVEEEHEILTLYNGQMFSLPHFQFKSANISNIFLIESDPGKFKRFP